MGYKFVDFITSDKVAKIAIGFLVAGEIKEFFEILNSEVLYPFAQGVTHGTPPKIRLTKLLRDIMNFFILMYICYLLLQFIGYIKNKDVKL